jgi:DNA-binding response OmpR family regulator
MSTVMVVDDEQRILRFLSRALSAEGHTVRTACSGRAALDLLRDQPVDLVLLDLVMPQGNGLQVLAALKKQENTTPVIVLSGVADVAARVQALDRGAIDFVAKPFHTAELVARIRRHTLPVPHEPPADGRYLSADGVRLDLDRRRVRVDGYPVEVVLSEREFALLAYLVRRRGEVCRRDQLLRDVWGLDTDPGSNVVEACLRRVRAKLSSVPIETVRGVGYCFGGTLR